VNVRPESPFQSIFMSPNTSSTKPMHAYRKLTTTKRNSDRLRRCFTSPTHSTSSPVLSSSSYRMSAETERMNVGVSQVGRPLNT
jgi:hypothetical protein